MIVGKTTIEIPVTDDLLHSILITAFDPGYGGSLYWGRVKREVVGRARPRREPSTISKLHSLAHDNEPFDVEVIEVVYEGMPRFATPEAFRRRIQQPQVEVLETHTLTRDKLMEGLGKWASFMSFRGRLHPPRIKKAEEQPNPRDDPRWYEHPNLEIDWDLDADDADAIVQFALFGKLVFG